MAAAARTLASRAPVGVIPPASPFAELLRRSRFASYDPEIKQTYSAPPAYAHRGNWGLKRPIAQRRRNAYITLKSYEDHAQYIEWNNAGAEVRFVKGFEELNITPTLPTGADRDTFEPTPFQKNLGPVQNSIWLTDSEFHQAGDEEYKLSAAAEVVVQEQPEGLLLESLGKKGKGGYGASQPTVVKAPLIERVDAPWDYRQPNYVAMSDKEFDEYLEKLRTIRPQFFKEIRSVHRERLVKKQMKNTTLNGDVTDLQLAALNRDANDHRTFLNYHFEAEYQRRDTEPAARDPVTEEAPPRDFVRPNIKPQPHRFGGLMYSHPSMLDTYYTTAPKSAFAIQRNNNPRDFIVSYGGVTAQFKGDAPRDVEPLFTTNGGPTANYAKTSVIPDVRLQRFTLVRVPSVVGKDGQGLEGLTVAADVVKDNHPVAKGWDNEYIPGTEIYSTSDSGSAPPVPLGLFNKHTSRSAFKSPQQTRLVMAKLKGLTSNPSRPPPSKPY